MSQFAGEAFFIGIKEGAKLFICAFLLVSFFKSANLPFLKRPFFAAVIAVFLAAFTIMRIGASLEVRDIVVQMIGYVFSLFYLASLGALFHAAGTDMLGPLRPAFEKKSFLIPAVFILTVVYFAPDMAGSSLYLSDVYEMSGRRLQILAAAGAGFCAALAAMYGGSKKVKIDAMKLFGLPQLLLFFALVKLIAGGVRGFAELSLIPSVQAGLMKLIHDVVHQTFVMLMVPDHPLLTVTAWNFIAVLFGNTVGLWLSLIVITLPLVIFIRKHFAERANVPPEMRTGAVKRKYIKSFRDEHILKSIPVFAFMLFIVSAWFIQTGESAARLYNPEPRPITAEGGMAVIPLHSPSEDLLDGSLHKFSININGEDVRLLIMKKPDGTLAVCLDACEICPPEGYAQAREHVVCLYCRTPIPFETVGKPGGCNPIPLTALVTEKDARIEVSEIADKWTKVKTGKTKETMER